MTPERGVGLAARCSMRVGGPAEHFARATDEAAVKAAVDWAASKRAPLYVLGGGTNVVPADSGVKGLVLAMDLRGVEVSPAPGHVEVTAAAGEPWDALVARAVREGWAGLECLSGIPGRVGATPIQNVGAYGQEIRETIRTVHAYDRRTGRRVGLTERDCRFGYRDSLFKSIEPGRYVVLAVTFRLRRAASTTVAYPDLERRLGSRAPTLTAIREAVLDIRRSKSMVLDDEDPNHRSCGSFFVNPIVSAGKADEVRARTGDAVPAWPQPDGGVKLSAAWLIQHAGYERGTRRGPVGLSTKHTLCIVAHEGATAREIVTFASEIRRTVTRRFGVSLVVEPTFWGHAAPGEEE